MGKHRVFIHCHIGLINGFFNCVRVYGRLEVGIKITRFLKLSIFSQTFSVETGWWCICPLMSDHHIFFDTNNIRVQYLKSLFKRYRQIVCYIQIIRDIPSSPSLEQKLTQLGRVKVNNCYNYYMIKYEDVCFLSKRESVYNIYFNMFVVRRFLY